MSLRKLLSILVAIIFVFLFVFYLRKSHNKIFDKPESQIIDDYDNKNRWRLYGDRSTLSNSQLKKFLNKVMIPKYLEQTAATYSKNSQTLQDGVPVELQQKMLLSSPLSCYSGKEGLFLKKYKKLLTALYKYAKIHRSMSSKSRTLVWHCRKGTSGGIADRTKGITFALLLAIFSERRLILDWESAVEDSHFEPNMINWIDKEKMWKYLSPKFLLQSINHDPYIGISRHQWSNYLSKIAGNGHFVVIITNLEMIALSTKLMQAVNQPWITEGLKITGLSNISDRDMADIIGLGFRYLIKMKSAFLQELSTAKEVLKLTTQPYIGVHIRTGFVGVTGVKDPWSDKLIKNRDDWKSGLQCAVSTANKFLGNNSLIFLATDSYLVKNMAISMYGMRFRSLNNSIHHVDRMGNKKEVGKVEKEGALLTFVDLFLLAQSYVIVMGSSGYSWMASLLCGQPNDHLIFSTTCKMYKNNVRIGV